MKFVNKPISKEALLSDLQNSYYMLERNFKLLSQAQTVYMKDWSLVESPDKTKLNAFLMEFSSLLHTYLASFASFVSHTEAIKDEIGKSEFEKEYWQQRTKWKTEKTAFVRDLHNFAHHRKLPMAGVGVNMLYTPDGLVANVLCGVVKSLPSLRVDDLLTYHKWTSASKNLLKREKREMEIMPFIDEAQKIRMNSMRGCGIK